MKSAIVTFVVATLGGCAVPSHADHHREARFELGASEFSGGDSMEIVGVRSSTGDFGVGAEIIVQVRYDLRSRQNALLYLGTTTIADRQGGREEEAQSATVARGKGQLELIHTIPGAGYPHVTLYDEASGKPFGGVYFGAGASLLASKDWRYGR